LFLQSLEQHCPLLLHLTLLKKHDVGGVGEGAVGEGVGPPSLARQMREAGLPPEHRPEQQSALPMQDPPTPASVQIVGAVGGVGEGGAGAGVGGVGEGAVGPLARQTRSLRLPPEHRPEQQSTFSMQGALISAKSHSVGGGVGASVGGWVGTEVGDWVGAGEGDGVGAVVGDWVGTGVGDGVGAIVGD